MPQEICYSLTCHKSHLCYLELFGKLYSGKYVKPVHEICEMVGVSVWVFIVQNLWGSLMMFCTCNVRDLKSVSLGNCFLGPCGFLPFCESSPCWFFFLILITPVWAKCHFLFPACLHFSKWLAIASLLRFPPKMQAERQPINDLGMTFCAEPQPFKINWADLTGLEGKMGTVINKYSLKSASLFKEVLIRASWLRN